MPMYIQFYPAFKPTQSLNSLEEQKTNNNMIISDSTRSAKQKRTLKKRQLSKQLKDISDVNIILTTEEEDMQKAGES